VQVCVSQAKRRGIEGRDWSKSWVIHFLIQRRECSTEVVRTRREKRGEGGEVWNIVGSIVESLHSIFSSRAAFVGIGRWGVLKVIEQEF
jgi:hypothetical protein